MIIRSEKWCVGRTFSIRIFRMVFAIDLWSISAKKCSGKTETRVQTYLQIKGGENNG